MTYSTIISVAALAGLAGENHDFQIWDCSFDLMKPGAGRAAFGEQHIAGARYIDLDQDLADHSDAADKASGGRHPLPARERFAAWVGAMGVKPSTQIIVYDRNGANYCGRAWWMLQWLGHERVAVLDGGLAAWVAAGEALESGFSPQKADFSMPKYPFSGVETAGTATYLIAIESVEKAVRKGSHSLIDARATPRFKGEIEPLDPVAGHIPGALNRPFGMNLDAQGFFKPADQLKAEIDKLLAGRDPAQVIHHCGSGVSAVPNIIAMKIAGFSNTPLFAGGWSQWCKREELPVAQG